jgi:hypothetical protein
MNKCNYKFLIGSKKGELCNKNCRGEVCGIHSQKVFDAKRDHMRGRRESSTFLEAERAKMAKRRKDSAYKMKELEYMKNYCEEKDISMNELWSRI